VERPVPAKVPEGWKLVPEDAHPLDAIEDMGKVIELLCNPPECPQDFDELDYYAMWWSKLLAAAPEYKGEKE